MANQIYGRWKGFLKGKIILNILVDTFGLQNSLENKEIHL